MLDENDLMGLGLALGRIMNKLRQVEKERDFLSQQLSAIQLRSQDEFLGE